MLRSPTRRRRLRCLLALSPLALLALALAACGGGGNSSGAAAGGVAGTTAHVGTKVTATETEYRIQLSHAALRPGSTTFVAVNKGRIGHSLEIDGPGVRHRRIAGTIAPGRSGTLTVTLRKGTYELYCPIAGHRALGMQVELKVGGGG